MSDDPVPRGPGGARIGVDLGGTKIAAVALDDAGETLAHVRIATPATDYDAILAAIAGVVARLEADVGGRCPVGIGTPGAISPASGRLKNSNTAALNGRALDEDLARALGRPIRMANDADCLALSEATDGAGAGARCVFAVILGTGVGGGLVVDGQLVRGPNAVTGEWGHNPLPWADAYDRPGAPCYCGRRGCIETFLCGAALSREFLARTGNRADGAVIATLAEQGHADALAALDRYADRLAKALASVINVLDPDVFVLGGGLSNVGALYDLVRARWGQWVFSDAVATRIVPARHGDASGVRGAARLWP